MGTTSRKTTIIITALTIISFLFVNPAAEKPVRANEPDRSTDWGAPSSVTLDIELDSPKISLGERLRLTVRVRWEGQGADFDISFPQPPACELLALVGSSASNKKSIENGVLVGEKVFLYTFEAAGSGTAEIEAVSAEYTVPASGDSYTLESTPIEITVSGQTVSFFSRHGKVLYASLAAVFLVGTVIGLVLLLRRRRSRVIVPEKEDSEKERFLEAIERCSRQRIEGDYARALQTLSTGLRSYLDEQYSLKAVEMTTKDIKTALTSSSLPEDARGATIEILEFSDLVKFAFHRPDSSEMDRLDELARGLVKGAGGDG